MSLFIQSVKPKDIQTNKILHLVLLIMIYKIKIEGETLLNLDLEQALEIARNVTKTLRLDLVHIIYLLL